MTTRYEISGVGQRAVMESTGAYSNIYNHWAAGHWYETPLLSYWMTLPVPDIYVDVGAHAGNHTVWAARSWPEAKVVAFEPDPAVWRRLVQNTTRNGVYHVQCRCTAAWGCASTAHLETIGPDEGMKRISVTAGIPVETETIDGALGRPEGKRVLIKIDTEGEVAPVLVGARDTLAANDCRLFVEGDPLHLEPELDHYGYTLTGKVFGATPMYEATKNA